jgi:hypothetical protein
LINDAAMQALGSYDKGKMLFLGLGTGLGTTLIVDGIHRADGAGPPALPQSHLRGLCRRTRRRSVTACAEAAGIYLDYSKQRITDETLRLLLALADECGLRERIDAMFPATRSTSPRTARCCTWRCARRAAPSVSTARTWCPKCTRCSTDGRFRRAGAQRRLEGPHRQAHPQRGQHRHRRLRPRAR